MGYHDQGYTWSTLGENFSVTSGTLKVELSNDVAAGTYVVADAVRIRRIGPWYADDGQSAAEGFTQTGSWTQWTGSGYGSTHSTAPGGDGSTSATWTFTNLAPGKYQVWTTWVQAPNRATNSPFTIYDGGASRGTILVDQTIAPANQFVAPHSWKSLGENFTIDSGTLTVKLTNAGVNSSKQVVADAIRIQRVGAYHADDTDGAGIFDTTAGWTRWTTSGYRGTHLTAPGGGGSTSATWTFKGLMPGVYEVWVTWAQAPNRATNAPFSVHDGSTLLNTVYVNQTVPPATHFDGGFSYVTLGQSYNVTSGTLVVKLSNNGVASNAYIVADAIRINRVGNPAGGTVLPFSATPGEGAMVALIGDGSSTNANLGAPAALARFSPPRRQPERFPVGGLVPLFQDRDERMRLPSVARIEHREQPNLPPQAPRFVFRDNAATNQLARRRIDHGLLAL